MSQALLTKSAVLHQRDRSLRARGPAGRWQASTDRTARDPPRGKTLPGRTDLRGSRGRVSTITQHRLSCTCQAPQRRDVRVSAAPEASSNQHVIGGKQAAAMLGGINLFCVGDNSELNKIVASSLATDLGYTPLVTEAMIEQLSGMGIDKFVEVEGLGALGATEMVVLNQVSPMVRCCVATAGGGGGAAARGDCWRYLYGGFTIWLDDAAEVTESAPQREAYQQAEMSVRIPAPTPGFVEEVKQQIYAAVHAMIAEDDQLCGKKGLYVRLGCRGDWPDMQPPGWNPDAPEETS